MKVAYLTNELPPYRRPIWELLASRNPDWKICLLLSVPKEQGRPWEPATKTPLLDVRVVRNITIRQKQARRDLDTHLMRLVHLPVGVWSELVRFRPDVVLAGGFGFASLCALGYSLLFRRPLVLVSEETAHTAAGISLSQRAVRRFLIRSATAFLAYGRAAERYLLDSGAPALSVHYCPQVVDTLWWSRAVCRARRTAIDMRLHLGVRGRVVLYAGQLVSRKGVHHLLNAWGLLPESIQKANTLLIVGDGDERDRLKEHVRANSISGVIFLGLQSPDRLPAFYALADLFVLPTLLDVWGLVVNEAMAAGVPVLVSRFAGCAEELVVEGVSGSAFDPRDERYLSELIATWLSRTARPPLREVAEAVGRLDFESVALGTESAISDACLRTKQ